MRVIQINAVYGYSSTGTIVKQIHDLSLEAGMDSRVAFSAGHGASSGLTFEIGSKFDHKRHALLSRIEGKQAYFSRGATKKLISYLEEFKPDIVHLHNLHSNYINLNMLLDYMAKNDIATVITMHDCWYFTGGCFHYSNAGCEKWKQTCGNCPKQRSDTPAYMRDRSSTILRDRGKFINAIPRVKIVGCSNWITNECRKSILGKNDIVTIHNGFNFEIFKPTQSNLRKTLGVENKPVLIGPAAKWLSDVNKETYQYFIENMDKDMILVLFGHPTPNDESPENVKYIGYLKKPEEMAALYSIGDVLVNCSREDTLSSINIEAQACGTPVVAFDATGNPETIDPKTGIVVPTGDAGGLLNGVREIIRSGKKRSYCRDFVIKHFNPEINYKKYIELYQSMGSGS